MKKYGYKVNNRTGKFDKVWSENVNVYVNSDPALSENPITPGAVAFDKILSLINSIVFKNNVTVDGILKAETIFAIGDYWRLVIEVNKDLVLYKYYNYLWEEAHRWVYEPS